MSLQALGVWIWKIYKRQSNYRGQSKKKWPQNVTRETLYLVIGLGLIAVTVWAGIWARLAGWFL